VLLRASRQWFIDTNQLKERAIQAVQDVKIRPESAANAFQVGEPLYIWHWCGSGLLG
jgi:isoleucyl-tRNA synthetase